MTADSRNTASSERTSSPFESWDDPTLLLLAVAVIPLGLAAAAAWRANPLLVVTAALTLAVAAGLTVWLIARGRDAHARRSDPPGPGVIVGTVRGSWVLAGRRPFELPWSSLLSHVLVAGPTGQGKSHTVIRPLLHALAVRSRHAPTGVFYLDGKGDRVDRQVPFDWVFRPEDPERSAHWNPLAGPDPVQAARAFAAALFPAAALPGASFYERKAVWVITRVAPAIALTGHGLDATTSEDEGTDAADADSCEDTLVERLIAAGIPERRARPLARRHSEATRNQLEWLPARADPSADALWQAITDDASAPPGLPDRPTLTAPSDWIHAVTPADLNRVVFDPTLLDGLRGALEKAHRHSPSSERGALLEQLATDLRSLTQLDPRERGEVLQTLGQGLGLFLSPPFLELCSRSDFSLADVCASKRVAFLLPVGRFGSEAAPLGRVALAQFTQSVLASPEDDATLKIALLDEFAQFVSPDFASFLAMARSRGGGAVCAVQSLSQLPIETRAAMLDNLRSRIVLAGSGPEDARYWSERFGREERERVSRSLPRPPPAAPPRAGAGARRAATRAALRANAGNRARARRGVDPAPGGAHRLPGDARLRGAPMTPRTIRLQPRDRRVLALLEERGPLPRHVLQVDCFPGIGEARVRNRLSELARAGFLHASGEGREARYTLPLIARRATRPAQSRRIALHARDLAVLELLVERRAETLRHLHERFWPDGQRKSARNRLGELSSAGYLHAERMPVPGSDGRLESIYTLGPKAKTALIIRGRGYDFHGRRFNPTLRTKSLPHQIATNRVADWLGARLVPEHLLPVRSRAELRHRPDGVYEAARPDAKGRDLVFLEVDLGSYSRERMLGKVAVFRASERARSILIVTPTPERARLVTDWVRDAYGPAALDEVQALSFQEVKAGMLDPGTEPVDEPVGRGDLAA